MLSLASFRPQLELMVSSEPEGLKSESTTLKKFCLCIQLHCGHSLSICGGQSSPRALTLVLDSPSFWKSLMLAPEEAERSLILLNSRGWDDYLGWWWRRCQGMRLGRQVGARSGGKFVL